MISESVQVINRQSALLADGQMIGYHLKLLGRQVFINILSRLFCSQVRAYRVR